MGRSLEFALTMLLVTIINTGFALFVVSIISTRITELFEIINTALKMGGI